MIRVSQKNHILNSVKIRHIKFSCCFAHILNQNKVFLFASFYRQFRNAYFPVAKTGTGTQKRSQLPLPFPEMFRKVFISISNAKLRLAKNPANATQHPGAEHSVFENYSHSSFTLLSKNNSKCP